MRGVIIALNYDGTRNRVEINSADILRELQWIVEGPIEQVPGFNSYAGYKCVAFCHEEGKLKELPFNHQATTYWYEALKQNNLSSLEVLLGNIAVVYGDKEFMEAL